MNIKIHDVMTHSVITIDPEQTIGHVRHIMQENKISAIPVVAADGSPVGIVSATDFISELDDNASINSIMTEKVYTIPQYDDVSIAARIMRNHKIHRVVVTHEKQVIGIVSAFDLLKLIEGHRFVAKSAPTESKRKGPKRV